MNSVEENVITLDGEMFKDYDAFDEFDENNFSTPIPQLSVERLTPRLALARTCYLLSTRPSLITGDGWVT